MQTTAPRRHKRIFLINRDFQLRYTKIAVAVGLCSTVLTITLILLPLFQLKILRFPNFVPYPFIVAMVLASLLNFLIIACMGILITHRIAGPMFSLVRHIRMVQLGQASGPLKVRDSDDMKFVVRNVNELIEHIADANQKSRAAVDGIVAALRRPDGQEALRLAEELRAELERRQFAGFDAAKANATEGAETA